MKSILSDLAAEIDKLPEYSVFGRVTAVLGMMVEIGGVERALSIGDRVLLRRKRGGRVVCEVVGFKEGRALAMPFSGLEGVGIGSEAEIAEGDPVVYPNETWLGFFFRCSSFHAPYYFCFPCLSSVSSKSHPNI